MKRFEPRPWSGRVPGPFSAMTLAFLLAANACAPGAYPPPPDARVDPVSDVIQGVEFIDDYRWLEDQNAPETRRWIEEQNAYAELIVGESPLRDRIRSRLRALTDLDDVGTPRTVGQFEYFTMRRAGEEAPVLYRRPLPQGEEEEPTVDGEYEVVLDPVSFDPSYRALLSAMDYSEDGKILMYSVRQGGADEIEVRFLDLESLQDLPDRLPNALYGGVSFSDDGTAVVYTQRSREIGPRIRRHELGTDLAADALLWGEGYGPTAFIGTRVVAGGRYRIFTAQHGWASNEIHLQDERAGGVIRPVAVGIPAHFNVDFHDGLLYVTTDYQAPLGRLLTIDPQHPEESRWREIIPEGEDLLQGISFVGDKIYANYLHDVSGRISVFDLDGTPTGEVAVPPGVSPSVRAGEDGDLKLTLRGHLQPPATWDVNVASGERLLADSSEVPFDATGFVVNQVWVTSADGTRAPMYVMHREGIELDGSHPTILNGYGGFTSAVTPNFSATAAVWMEMGGIYAVATLRGGSEYGEEWHREGMLENKQNVFDDFIAASEWLIENGYTSPDHLAISGASNGGLLVAAAMTQRPELYRAVLCAYPDLDMVRFNQFTQTNNMPALLEYGDAAIPSQFEAIRRYSPYQAVRDDVDYPAVMLATGDLDSRVPPLQARRMTARLQAATGSGLPVILWYDSKGGHAAGRGRPTSLRIEDTARELTFLAQQLGLDDTPPVR